MKRKVIKMNFVLSEDGKILVNVSNVASFYIKQMTGGYKKQWQIVAMYPAVSTDVLCDVLAEFEQEKDCVSAFNVLIASLSSRPTLVCMRDCIRKER